VEILAALLVGKPLNILVVAISCLAGHLVLRSRASDPGRRSLGLIVAAVAWALYAGWEWLVLVRTPEADIRVDLLVIWPCLAIVSAWAIFRAIRSADAC
jgi:hypothetical protein